MAAQSLKHSVLVAGLLSDVAMQRLSTFFEVETRLGGGVPSHDELVNWLHGKAGVITDSRFIFDAPLIGRLPTLKAICNLDSAHHNLDLSALTQAGIRATHTPEPNPSIQTSAQRAWQAIQPVLSRAVPVASEAGRYASWSRKVVLGPSLQATCLGILSEPCFVKALTALAQSAQVTVCADRDTALRSADVLVVDAASAQGLNAADRARMKLGACVFTLPADVAPFSDALDVLAQPWVLQRSDMAAESMVASLGFGRNSWHPQHLLNPEISCDSCC